MYLSVIIPAYNEEKRLPETLKKVRDFLNQQKYDWEVIIVSDGSKDQTAAVISEWIKSQGDHRFHLIDNKDNQGKGAVVKQGILEAKGEWRLFMDADGSTDISQLDKFWEFIKLNSNVKCQMSNETQNQKSKIQIIIGSRYLNKGSIKIKQPLSRRIVSRVGNLLVRIILGIKSVDTQCGFKLFSAHAAEDIFPKQTIGRWGFDVEILAIALKLGYKIKEVPVDWFDAGGSKVKAGAALKTFKELFEIRRRIKRI